jgi:hypothetical protein
MRDSLAQNVTRIERQRNPGAPAAAAFPGFALFNPGYETAGPYFTQP